MKKLTSQQIRETWLNFFKERGHMVEPGASLVPYNDPTLLWINSGVAALKKYFDGSEIPACRRITNVQKSIRTNDIENVGQTARHHTFFEMLGNFSIGDYFRKEIVPWAFEILTSEKYFNLDKEKIYVTYNPIDPETKALWIQAGLDESHLIPLETNYWQIGEGPCGPNTEVFYDRGEKYDPEHIGIKLLQEEIENDRYIEIWGIVFSQFNAENGVDRKDYKELPSKNIDTGAGLERICCIIQETETNFETDLFMPIIKELEKISSTKYEENKTAYRVIADHIRSCSFALADGAVFSNEGRGYVLRRLLRRAMKFARHIGLNRPFLNELVDVTVDNMKSFYPYLETKKDYIKNLIKKEEEKFIETLNSGVNELNDIISKTSTITGKDAFKLYDTYGFPFELTNEIALENNIKINKDEFDELMNLQKERARASRNVVESMNKQSKDLMEFTAKSTFNYSKDELVSKVIGLFVDGEKVDSLGGEGYVIFEETPFYAEMGGQIYDIGSFTSNKIEGKILAVTLTPNKQNLHKVIVEKGELKIGDEVRLTIDSLRRRNIESNHSATHLLHKALKEVLGEDIQQKGSFVNENYLRFDFDFGSKLTQSQLNEIENLVNRYIELGIEEKTLVLPYDEAVKTGADHEFNEKYGSTVRVVTFGEVSKEFCGGTHVKNSKDIGSFMIKSEESISAGVRRIEAVTGYRVYKNIKELQGKIENINSILSTKSINETIDKLKVLLQEKVSLSEKILDLNEKLANLYSSSLIAKKVEINGYDVVVSHFPNAERETLVKISDQAKVKLKEGIVVLIGKNKEGSLPIIVTCTKNIKINCNLILKGLTAKFGGSGGGRPDFVNGVVKDFVPEIAKEILKETIK